MTHPKIQSEVEAALLVGEHHSVGTIYTRWHTHDGRKITSRIRRKWAKEAEEGKPVKTMGHYWEKVEGTESPYKVFFLEKQATATVVATFKSGKQLIFLENE